MIENNHNQNLAPQWLIVKIFILMILGGTLFLSLPISSRSGVWTNPVTALFMATSATCVAGHTVVDVGSYFSYFGQLIILFLFQLGGLGFMTLATFLLVLAGRRLTIKHELVIDYSLGLNKTDQLKSLLIRSVIFTMFLELAATIILTARLVFTHGSSFGSALYHALFHSVSAFCNAGLCLYPDSLISLRADKVIVLTFAMLIVLGGLGFLVLRDLTVFKFWRRNKFERGRLTLHTKIVLFVSVFLLLAGWLMFGVLEWRSSLSSMTSSNRLIASLFQSVTARTAGFSVVSMAKVHPSTRFATLLLMFIGGSPGSTAGGIKTTTAIVLFFCVIAMIRGRSETVIFGRTISGRIVVGALAIFLLSVLVISFLYGLLLVSEQNNLVAQNFTANALLFETVSAFGTVGLSTGIMPGLSTIGKLIIIICMFIGRVGPLTVALIVGMKGERQIVRYPSEDILVG